MRVSVEGDETVVGSVLVSVFNKLESSVVVVVAVSVLEFCPSQMLSGVKSLQGRPLFRFGDREGFPSSVGDVGCGEGEGQGEGEAADLLSGSVNLGGVLGGRPLFLLKGVTKEFKLDSEEEGSVFLG